jgi:phage tail tape-measure protein
MMRKSFALGMVLAAGMSLSACTSYDRYGDNQRVEDIATGAAIGAAAGAGVGAVVGGVSPVEGAAAGAVVGGVAGALAGNNRDWRRDSRGYCFYYNDRGERIYDYDKRC